MTQETSTVQPVRSGLRSVGKLVRAARPYRLLTLYLAAVLAVALAALATTLLWPVLKAAPVPLFLAATVLAAWVGGIGPGLLATGLSAVALEWCLRVSPSEPERWYEGVTGLVIFVAVSVVIGALVAERRWVEKSTRESRAFLQATLDSLSARVAVIDGTGAIVAANASWRLAAAVDGPPCWRPGETGTNYLEGWGSKRGSREGDVVCAAVRDVLGGGRHEFVAQYAQQAAGEERWFEVRVRRFEGAPPVRAVVSHEDVTERRHADEAQRRAATLQSIARLASAAAHEINNPLAIILGNVEIVAQEAPRETGARIRPTLDAVERIRAVVLRMARLNNLEVSAPSPGLPDMLDLHRSSPAPATRAA